jgi:hypothetical protein
MLIIERSYRGLHRDNFKEKPGIAEFPLFCTLAETSA